MASPIKVRVLADKTQQIFKGISELAETRVLAGVPAEKGVRTGEGDEGPINNAQLMYIHENGAPEANIPARPVVVPGIKSEQSGIRAALAAAGARALSGDITGMRKAFNAAGILAQNGMRKRITEGPFVALSERTLAARRAAGFKGDKPLIRSGQLRRALTYVIRRVTWTGKFVAKVRK